MILERLGDRSYLQKFKAIVGEVFFLRYMNIIGSKIDESDLIYTSYAPDMFPKPKDVLRNIQLYFFYK
jgi:hypothetical protein